MFRVEGKFRVKFAFFCSFPPASSALNAVHVKTSRSPNPSAEQIAKPMFEGSGNLVSRYLATILHFLTNPLSRSPDPASKL